jgi:predicted unusual protein kinase regulating ubiquinone biosynthesis (AarF/ABC1/UbiB family)
MNLLLSLLSLLPLLQVVVGFTTQIVSPLSQRTASHRAYGCYATTEEKEKESKTIDVATGINGVPPEESFVKDFDASHITEQALSDITEVMDEISKRINDGSMEFLENITTVMDQKLVQLPESASKELSEYISDVAKKLQNAQQQELQRQLVELEKRFVEPLEQLAFSDAPLFDTKKKKTSSAEGKQEEMQRILAGKNSTLTRTSRMRTGEILGNFNVAPLYYSAALMYRWARKVSYPSVYVISGFKGMSSLVKTNGPRKKKRKGKLTYEEYIKDAETMQSGWKRTGEIAAKGSMSKKWAILRRSAEIWGYFSSFYLKDRRINKNFQSGKWSEEKFKEERSKLGAEITQNLLRLGPTFIKVRVNGSGLILYDSRFNQILTF